MATTIHSIATKAPLRAWRTAQSQVARLSPYYLVPVAISFPVAIFLNYVWADDVLIKGHPLSLIASFAGAAVSGFAWLFYAKQVRADSLLTIFLLGNIVAWLVIATLVWRDGDQFNFATWLAPTIFLLILVKPPSLRAIYLAADTFALGLLLIAVLSHVLHLSGVLEFPTDGAASRLPTVFNGFGLEQRWPGPFASTSDAGPVGGFLVMYALLRNGPLRLILAIGGLLILIASASYTAGFAVILGLVTTMWFVRWSGSKPIAFVSRAMVSLFALGAAVLFIGATDPTLNARTPLWADYLDVWVRYPLLGLGTNGILSNMEWFTHQHAHNYYVDILTRHGLVGFVATVPLIMFAGFMAFRAGHRGLVAIPGLFVCWAAALFGETLIDWRYLGYVLAEFLFIGLIAATYLRDAASETDRSQLLQPKALLGTGTRNP